MKRRTKIIILSYEHVDALAEGLPKLRGTMCSGEPVGGTECKTGAFRLSVTKCRRMVKLYSDSQYISRELQDTYCLAQMFNVAQQQLRDHTVAMPDVLSYVTKVLNSLTYVELAPNANTYTYYPHLTRNNLH